MFPMIISRVTHQLTKENEMAMTLKMFVYNVIDHMPAKIFDRIIRIGTKLTSNREWFVDLRRVSR